MQAVAEPKALSDKKLAANRANAQRSTGPRTPEGKARSALNATTHAGFAAATILPHEDPDPFCRFRKAWVKTYSPQTLPELYLIDRAISLAWRLRRLQAADTDLHCVHPERTPAENLARAYCVDADNSSNNQFDRLMRAEDRLQGMLHRTLRQFHQLQKAHYQTPPSIDCPFLEEDADQNQDEKEKLQNEPTADLSPSPGTPGEGRGEGNPPTTHSAVSQNKPTDPASVPSVSSVAEPPNPPAQEKLQNEPTAPHHGPALAPA